MGWYMKDHANRRSRGLRKRLQQAGQGLHASCRRADDDNSIAIWGCAHPSIFPRGSAFSQRLGKTNGPNLRAVTPSGHEDQAALKLLLLGASLANFRRTSITLASSWASFKAPVLLPVPSTTCI